MQSRASLPLLLVVLLVVLLLGQAEGELASSSGLDAPQPARGRIKAKAENMSTLASSTGESFNIRHGRSRAHMLHPSTSSSNMNSTRLTLVSDVGKPAAPATPMPPTQQPDGGGAPVTHKIRKLHKKKINESIRKSVDKSLGLVRTVKNHRSLAEAEHLQGRPTDVDDGDEETAALSEIMQLADEIDLENSLESAYPNAVAVEPTSTQPTTEIARSPGAGAATATAAMAAPAAGRQFVRANSDDANYEDSGENDELSTTEMATFAPRQPAANGAKSWQLQQTRVLGRTRLLPVNQSNSRPFALNVNAPLSSGAMDYQLEVAESRSADNDESGDGYDADDEDVALDEATAAAHEAGNSSVYSAAEWPEAESGVRSQAITSQQDREGLVVKQINFNLESESGSESGPESEVESETETETDSMSVLDTSEVTMDDGYPPEVLIDDKTKPLVIGDVEGDGVDSNQITADVINARDSKIDLVSKFLQYIEQQHLMGSNCVAGTSLNLGEGVVDRYAQDRFRVEAEVAVNRANMLTR
ncbi:hypothetical protein AWZ03_002051 [Drosophila navojoa]|uniref:Uncharacterized protein n=2 Tax=Drosophila navojoa TaxID=7232 RepID=A0A484BUZ4_DRONA|nr:hypothetical protein AWZ03_002051 [Drosophila navojoa]